MKTAAHTLSPPGGSRGAQYADDTRAVVDEEEMTLPSTHLRSVSPGTAALRTIGSAAMAATVPYGTGPSTAELAAEMLTPMSAQGLVVQQHQAQTTPADNIVNGVPLTQAALTNVVALMTGEQYSPPLPNLSMPVDNRPKN